jgi:hypothetical protein
MVQTVKTVMRIPQSGNLSNKYFLRSSKEHSMHITIRYGPAPAKVHVDLLTALSKIERLVDNVMTCAVELYRDETDPKTERRVVEFYVPRMVWFSHAEWAEKIIQGLVEVTGKFVYLGTRNKWRHAAPEERSTVVTN